jgi:hypothetical protein
MIMIKRTFCPAYQSRITVIGHSTLMRLLHEKTDEKAVFFDKSLLKDSLN